MSVADPFTAPGEPSVPLMLPMNTKRPDLAARILGKSARVSTNGARKFTSSCSSQAATDVSSMLARTTTPAL